MARHVTIQTAFVVLLLRSIALAASLPSVSATTPADDELWIAAVEKGTKVWRQMRSGCAPDTVKPLSLEILLALGFRIGDDSGTRWPPDFDKDSHFPQNVDRFFKWTESVDAYWTTDARRDYFTPWHDETSYWNTYSPLNGLIAALDITKARIETAYWSEVTFAIWEAVTTFSKTDISKLRYIAHRSVTNDFTESVLDRIVCGKPGFVKAYGQGTSPFYALLGTPNGGGSAHLLMQHKRQLGFKTITQAVVFGNGGSKGEGHDVVFVVRDMPIARLGRFCNIWDTAGNESLAVS